MAEINITNEAKEKLKILADLRDTTASALSNEIVNSYLERESKRHEDNYLIGALQTIEHAADCGENVKPLISKLKTRWIEK